jgi:hypothetical protein
MLIVIMLSVIVMNVEAPNLRPVSAIINLILQSFIQLHSSFVTAKDFCSSLVVHTRAQNIRLD